MNSMNDLKDQADQGEARGALTRGVEGRVDVACCLCGSVDRELIYLGEDRLLRHPGTFPIVRCRTCGLIYQSPRPSNIAPYYEGDYMCYDGKPIEFKPILKRKRRFSPDADIQFYGSSRAYCEILHAAVPSPQASHPPTRRLLDVGCGPGDFIAAAEALGWEVYGVEPNASVAQMANKRLKNPSRQVVTTGLLEPGLYDEASFDAVTLWHVIEHLENPAATMHEVVRILRPNGLCIIQTPRWQSLESRVFGKNWSGLDSPRHFWIFLDRTLEALLKSCGLHIETKPSSSSYPLYVLSIKFLLNSIRKGLGNNAFQFLHRPSVDRIGAALTWTLLDWTKAASNLTVIAKRNDYAHSSDG